MEYDIFLSYRRTDSDLAKTIVEKLEAQGARVWWDQKIPPGQDWRDSIVENLESSSVLVILFSEDCNASHQIKKELAVADHIGKMVIPVLIEDTQPKGHFLYELAARNWIQVHPDPMSKVDTLTDGLMGAANVRPVTTTATEPVRDPPRSAGSADAETNDVVAAGPAATGDPVETVPEEPSPQPTTAGTSSSRAAERREPVALETKGEKPQRDFLPFLWWDAIPIGGAAFVLAQIDGNFDATNAFVAVMWSTALYGVVAFPIRYFLRRRSPYRVAKSLLFSNLVLMGGMLVGAAGLGEKLDATVIGAVFGVGIAFSVGAFVLFAGMSAARARKILKANIRKI